MMPEAYSPVEAHSAKMQTVTVTTQTVKVDPVHSAKAHLAKMATTGRVSGNIHSKHYKAQRRSATFIVQSSQLPQVENINSVPGEPGDDPSALILSATTACTHPSDWTIGSRSDGLIIPLTVKVRQIDYKGSKDITVGLSDDAQSIRSKRKVVLAGTSSAAHLTLVKREPNLAHMKAQSSTGRVSSDDVRNSFVVIQRGNQTSFEIEDNASNVHIREVLKRFLDERATQVDPQTYTKMYTQEISKTTQSKLVDGVVVNQVSQVISARLFNEFMEYYEKNIGNRVDMIQPDRFGLSVRPAMAGNVLSGSIRIVVDLVYIHSSNIEDILAVYAIHHSGMISAEQLHSAAHDTHKLITAVAPQVAAAPAPSQPQEVMSEDEEDEDDDE